jgi:protein O-GlcNAc transferase
MNRKERRALAKTGRPGAGSATASAMGRPANSAALLANATRHYQAGRLQEARRICQQILAGNPDDIAALHLIGLMALQGGANEAARNALTKAIGLNDRVPDLHSALAEALQRLGRLDEAVRHYRRSIALDPDYVEALYNGGNVLVRLKQHEEALANFNRVLAVAPNFAEAINNRGSALFELGRYADALADFDRALSIKPEFVDALSNRGAALVGLKQYEEAIASCDRALAIDSNNVSALAHRGNAHFELRRFAEAAHDFGCLLGIDPDYAYAAGRALFCRLLYCDWTDYEQAAGAIMSKVAVGKRAVAPFMFLTISDSAEARLQCAQIFSRDKHPASPHVVWQGERYGHAKIRVAYLSADFRHHPAAYLTAGLFEAHDKSRFETMAISFGPDPKDEFRRRLENAFDRFVDVQAENDRDVALLLRELEIDIAVDLMGYTNNCRPGILAFRPAPIQVNFVGFAGTMGADYIDYIIADRFVVPDDCRLFYTERVIYLPDTYFPTDSKQSISEYTPLRSEVGLPERGFVFCSFNNNYKILPPIFDVWMRLLKQVGDSVLWLVEDNAAAARNLRLEAEHRGVAPDRLVFAPRIKLEDYLARLRVADLFLDTSPYNAHTTASDALWAGLPVITCAGASFASRVAGSLLNAMGLPELVTSNLQDYEALALELTRNPGTLARIRARLAQNRKSFPLFDTTGFCRHIESAYQTMWERYEGGKPPASFAVPREPAKLDLS